MWLTIPCTVIDTPRTSLHTYVGMATPYHELGAAVNDCLALQGTLHLVDAAKRAGVKKFVLMSSLLTNGRDAGQGTNPNFVVLNLFGGVLDQKLKVGSMLLCKTTTLINERPSKGIVNAVEATIAHFSDTCLAMCAGREVP